MSVNLKEMSRRAKIGGKKQSSKYTYRVENEYVTSQQIADRLQITIHRTRDILQRARKRPEPLTWALLASYQ